MKKSYKIAIGMNIQKGPFGGGNGFGQTLVDFLKHQGIMVVHSLKDPDIDLILLTETRPWLKTCAFDTSAVIKYLHKKRDTLIVLRINECNERKGGKIKLLNKFILQNAKWADQVIFISAWLQNLFLRPDPSLKHKSTVILNGADEKIFNPLGYKKWEGKGPLRLVTHHWGAHWYKGFDVYLYLDQLCEGKLKDKVQFTFIGNLPKNIRFKNTNVLPPKMGKILAMKLKENHIYLTASINEPAGMHHIEGALCGLPLLYRNSGALPEYCQGYGITFQGPEDLRQKLMILSKQYSDLADKMSAYPYTAEKMSRLYYQLFLDLLQNKKNLLQKRNSKNSHLLSHQVLQKILYLQEKCLINI